jgi:holo-[acyl-carrier protein] synthase
MEARLKRRPALRNELFTRGELRYCDSRAKPHEHLAARFCAKEAVAKALGMDGFDPLDIEIVAGGAHTRVALRGEAKARAAMLAVTVTISLTHIAGMASAVALARHSLPLSSG